MASDPELRSHQEWLGYLQPVGLVVSPPALHAAQAWVNRAEAVRLQAVLEDLVDPGPPPCVNDFPGFCRTLLGWAPEHLAGSPDGPPLPEGLDVSLPEYGEVLSPTYAVPDAENDGQPLMLVRALPRTIDLDAVEEERQSNDRAWHAGPQARFERLLREREIPIGLLWNGTHLRLVHAPRGESSGHLTFPVAAMLEVPGRPILGALHMLLSAERVFRGPIPQKHRLAALLRDSRRYQNEVSTKLAGQVLAALHELLRGFQAADDASHGELLREVLQRAPQDVYGGLLGTLMRLVFVLYAEERELLPSRSEVYAEHYSVGGLFARLRDDNARFPDTMDQRHGAWARLLTLFRLIHDGAAHGNLRLPARHGRLFDPDTWDFLEGRPYHDILDRAQRIDVPRVSDGVVYRVLENLLVLDGERLSYRVLDVEQIGSVYEAMMGFELRVAQGPSIGVKPDHVVVDFAELLAARPAERVKRLKDEAACTLSGPATDALKAAKTPEDVVGALGKKVSPHTPRVIPKTAMFLQPTDERRRSGSHYTPRSLTEPIVSTTLEPLLKNLGDSPTAEQILSLKVCDPAMGSGAFLVEACRYLGTALEQAWNTHGEKPDVPADEEPLLYARRLVAQRCLYGVDKNPYAVDLAKLSLWLATLARDHPFTFLDHALRHGDSLVGLTRDQIASFHWEDEKQVPIVKQFLDTALAEAETQRAALFALADSDDQDEKARLNADAVEALHQVRDAGDLVVAAFFGAEKTKDRERLRQLYRDKLQGILAGQTDPKEMQDVVDALRSGPRPVPPFHWEIEFPEVFSREDPGFDAFVGNPPFLGGTMISTSFGTTYLDYITSVFSPAGNRMDLVAYFFRRAFSFLATGGAFGLIGTNTVAQGDTRTNGLRVICNEGGRIFSARRRLRWPAPGAAVNVSVVHAMKGRDAIPAPVLDGTPVPQISAFLFHRGANDDPIPLLENRGIAFSGMKVYGQGFLFADDDDSATRISEMERLIERDSRNQERIFPYLGGEEVNESPTHSHARYVIDFEEMTLEQAQMWPDLLALLERTVKPDRAGRSRAIAEWPWWLFWRPRGELRAATSGLERVLVLSEVSKHHGLAFVPSRTVCSHRLVVFALDSLSAFAALQSRAHEVWTRFFGSTFEDRPVYSSSSCFEPFPFAAKWKAAPSLEGAGRACYDFRAALMVRNGEGLTKTYNRFHDPDNREPDIVELRRLHDAMDRAVLDAYGWTDIQPTCEFLLDYEEEEDPDDDPTRKRRKKKPWRYRWPDDTRDEVLARLLALNQECAQEEALAGHTAEAGARAARDHKRRKPRRRSQQLETRSLFSQESDRGSKKGP